MTPQQHNEEAVRTHQMHMEAMGRVYDRTQGAMADIHAKVISEPWYGRDVFDHTFDKRMGYLEDQGKMQGTEKAPENVQGTGQAPQEDVMKSFYGNGPATAQGTVHGPQAPQEDVMKSFYGNGPAAAQGTAQNPQEDVMKSFYGNGQEPGHAQGQGKGQGIEP